MPIYSRNPLLLAGEDIKTEATSGEVFSALFGQTMAEGLLGSMARIEEINTAETGRVAYGSELAGVSRRRIEAPQSPLLTPEAARAQLRDAKLDENLSIPMTGIRQETLDILIERKRNELRRDTILSQASGVGSTFAGLAGGFAGSLVDPTNIALAFVPVVGEARYAALLSRAGGLAGRTGVRLGVGGVEGLAGLAPVEVLNYYANQQQQADYDAYDSMVNIAGGMFFGSALHAGAGLLGDAIRWRSGTELVAPPPGRAQPETVPGAVAGEAPTVRLPTAAERERAIIMDRLAEGKPVTRQQVEALAPRTGADAGQIIDTRLAALREAAAAGRLSPEQAKALAAEGDELEMLVRAQDKAAKDGVQLSPANRLTPEERALADQRRVQIKKELEAHRASMGAGKELSDLEAKLGKIDRDADLIALAAKLAPERAEGEAFVESLSTAVTRALNNDPFMPVRPFIARTAPETQANALRMGVAQALEGRPIDVTPALLTDPNSFDPPAAFAAANANAKMVAGADNVASEQADLVTVVDGTAEELAETFAQEKSLVDRLYADAGVEVTEAEAKAIAAIDEEMRVQSAAADQAAACLMRTAL